MISSRTRFLGTLAVAMVIAFALSGCAGSNPLVGTAGNHGVAGFWAGLWHGLICPIAYVISLFNRKFSMYEVHNNGAWYNAGFLLGAGAGGLLRGSSSSKKR